MALIPILRIPEFFIVRGMQLILFLRDPLSNQLIHLLFKLSYLSIRFPLRSLHRRKLGHFLVQCSVLFLQFGELALEFGGLRGPDCLFLMSWSASAKQRRESMGSRTTAASSNG